MRRVTRLGAAAAVIAAGAIGGSTAVSAQPDHGHHPQRIQHVLLISVDGMHQSDLNWYVAHHPGSELAKLASGGAEFTNNHTADPSDSDPGGTAIMTGGDPRATGVYYDVEYSHAVDEAGAACTLGQPATGGDVIYDSPDDKLNAVPDFLGTAGSTFPSFDADGSIYSGLNNVDKNPAAIMNMTPTPQTALNPGSFPVDPKTCQPIMPWDYLKVNSIFGVIHNAGLRTAWSDKHSIYTSFNGHGSGGHAIDDFFGPEIDSQAVEPNGTPYPTDTDWAHDDAATKQYDAYKVQAVINELGGYDHSGTTPCRHTGDPRHELPDRVGRREGRLAQHPDQEPGRQLHGGADGARRLPPGHDHAGPAAVQRARLRRRPAGGDGQRDPEQPGDARNHGDHHHGQARPVAAGPAAAQADQGRTDHRRGQRGLDRARPVTRTT